MDGGCFSWVLAPEVFLSHRFLRGIHNRDGQGCFAEPW